MKNAKILWLIPADGWFAVFRTPAGGDKEFRSPLVCWALVDGEDGERTVVGLDTDQRGTVEICAYADNFLRYEFGQVGRGRSAASRRREVAGTSKSASRRR